MPIRSLVLYCLLVAACAASTARAHAPASRPASLFDDPRVWQLHVRLSADAWKRMQPAFRPRFLPRTPAPLADAAPQTRPVISPWGYVFNYARGTLDVDGVDAADIDIRFKGNYSYSVAANTPRRPMKIEFDRHEPGRRVLGLTTLNLNISAVDPSLIREPLGYAIFRAAGVPAPRTAFARVLLTVDGLYNKHDLGIYILVEQVDDDLLARHFGAAGGLLLKPEMLRGIPYLGAHWPKYADRYGAKQPIPPDAGPRFVQFLQLIHFADDPTFAARIGEFLHIDSFLRFTAVQAMIVNFDSFFTTGHNYYLYQHPADGKYRFLPWDLNLAFGAFGMVAGPQQQLDLSLRSPFVPPNRLMQRLLAVPAVQEQYQHLLKQIAQEAFTPQQLRDWIAPMQGVVGPVADVASLQSWVLRRAELVQEQLAGKRQGFIPGKSPGLLLADAWDSHRRESLVQSATAALKATILTSKAPFADVKHFATQWLSVRGDAITTRDLAEALSDALPVPENYVFDPGPGIEWARIAFRIADLDNDGRLTTEELAAALDAALPRTDANKDRALDAAEAREILKDWAAGKF